MASALEGLGDLVLETILYKLEPRNVAVFACVSSRCRASASDDNLWRLFCSQDLHLLQPQDPDGNPCPSFMVAYQMWRESFGMYPWALVRRVKKCWGEIKSWMMENFPESGNTLQKGASEMEIVELEEKLGLTLPVPTKVLYRFCNGQNTMKNVFCETKHLSPMGIIGGYCFYDHTVNVHLLPLSLIIEETRNCASFLDPSVRSEYIVVAVSYYDKKFFFLNCNNGQLYVGTGNLVKYGETLPCVPHDLIRLRGNNNSDLQQDGLLLWLEEHARRLQGGIIQVRNFHKTRMINLFPELPPFCSTAVTSGVQVCASAVFVPEVCNLNSDGETFWFSYSIRMHLLPEGCMLDGVHYTSCQLFSRHWLIRANDLIVSDVHGEAVIGKYPLLSTNTGEFVYESCTPLSSSVGSVEGSFTFVPGRLTSPEGRQFEVEVALFPLEVPSYIF